MRNPAGGRCDAVDGERRSGAILCASCPSVIAMKDDNKDKPAGGAARANRPGTLDRNQWIARALAAAARHKRNESGGKKNDS